MNHATRCSSAAKSAELPDRAARMVLFIGWLLLLAAWAAPANAEQEQNQQAQAEEPFVETVKAMRPSVVAIGSYQRDDTPTIRYFGTGFVVEDGRMVVTNAHVIEALRRTKRLDDIRCFFPDGGQTRGREAKVLLEDAFHDVALIAIEGRPAPAVKLAKVGDPPQGRGVGVLGYPIGTLLGLQPAAHKGVVAAVVPAVRPQPSGTKITPQLAAAIKKPYNLYQLDMVVYPGNSGSPLFDARNGEVVGIINMQLAWRTREVLFEKPSGIGYAVPVRWIHDIIRRHKALNSE